MKTYKATIDSKNIVIKALNEKNARCKLINFFNEDLLGTFTEMRPLTTMITELVYHDDITEASKSADIMIA